MCSYITEKTRVSGSAKGPAGWMRINTANVYFDHPYHAPFDHALAIDFMCEGDGTSQRVAVELSAASARALIRSIEAALASGEAAHGPDAHDHAQDDVGGLRVEPLAALSPAATAPVSPAVSHPASPRPSLAGAAE